ncbi:MAG: acylneuraminate cytidylyltransferase family protein [Candidatus Omnitrophica bacterium]|nr:acylneuraminate cytidylyltransferase family protein [Candidatus Omnitrophota bacterium]MBU2266235.1 acylneuraminate cytidylyltransferase family protein [Candidatus Omnitrophota bacterium]
MEEVVAVIPARSGSRSVIDKNIKLLGGRPLFAYTIAAATATANIDRVIVSTDSEHYADIARKYKADVPFLRPKEISGDSSTDYEFIKHLLDWLQDNQGYQPKYLVHLRPTTPFREISYIEGAISRIKEAEESVTALRSVHAMTESVYKAFDIEEGYLKSIGSGSLDIEAANRPRQEFATTYQANGYVDIIKSAYVREAKKIHGDRVIAYVTPQIFEVDIPEDFGYLEYQIGKDPNLARRIFG